MRIFRSIILATAGVGPVCGTLYFPDSFPLLRRQDISPGTPAYECHANCGGVIVDARTDGYCDSSDYTSKLSACLECALTYNIWQWYGEDVTKAADACGDNATPSPSSAVSTAAATTAASVTTSSSVPSSSPAVVSTPISEASSSTPASSPTGSFATISSSSAVPSASSNISCLLTRTVPQTTSAATATPTTEVFTGAASKLSYNNIFAIFGSIACVILVAL
ncbi:hypothetical protein M432DRAFT_630297 [Thermoascus aurantiacus ATCC 26904]